MNSAKLNRDVAVDGFVAAIDKSARKDRSAVLLLALMLMLVFLPVFGVWATAFLTR